MKSEQEIQRDICVTIWNLIPETRYCLYHVKNELDRALTKQELIKLMQQKASGFIEGIQDLHFIWNGALWLMELKDDKGTISPAQKIIHAAHAKQGLFTFVFKDSQPCIDFVRYIVEHSHLPGYVTEIVKHVFSTYISPYAKPEMLDVYIKEYDEWKEHQKQLRYKRDMKKVLR